VLKIGTSISSGTVLGTSTGISTGTRISTGTTAPIAPRSARKGGKGDKPA